MTIISRSALVPFSAEQMFNLVDDIESYHLFVPYCKTSSVIERLDNQVTAKLLVAKSGIAKSFTTQNKLDKPNKIFMQLVDGPFSHLSGGWQFISLSESACKIELELDFEFKNKLASFAFAKVFKQLIESMVTAFTERAEKIYNDES